MPDDPPASNANILSINGKNVDTSPYTPAVFRVGFSLFPPDRQQYILDNWNKSSTDPECKEATLQVGPHKINFVQFLANSPAITPRAPTSDQSAKRPNENEHSEHSRVNKRARTTSQRVTTNSMPAQPRARAPRALAVVPDVPEGPFPDRYKKYPELESDSAAFDDLESRMARSDFGNSDYDVESYSSNSDSDSDGWSRRKYDPKECPGHVYTSYGFIKPHSFPARCTKEAKADNKKPRIVRCRDIDDFIAKMRREKTRQPSVKPKGFENGSTLFEKFENIEGKLTVYHIPFYAIFPERETYFMGMSGFDLSDSGLREQGDAIKKIAESIHKLEDVYPFARYDERKWLCIDKLHSKQKVSDYSQKIEFFTSLPQSAYCRGELSVLYSVDKNVVAIRHWHKPHPCSRKPRDPVLLNIYNIIVATLTSDDAYFCNRDKFFKELNQKFPGKRREIARILSDLDIDGPDC